MHVSLLLMSSLFPAFCLVCFVFSCLTYWFLPCLWVLHIKSVADTLPPSFPLLNRMLPTSTSSSTSGSRIFLNLLWLSEDIHCRTKARQAELKKSPDKYVYCIQRPLLWHCWFFIAVSSFFSYLFVQRMNVHHMDLTSKKEFPSFSDLLGQKAPTFQNPSGTFYKWDI